MKEVALNNTHIALGAKMVPFAGFNMPVSYAGVNVEHQCVREAVGVFDVSHMGSFWVKGANATALLQKVCSNNISALNINQAQYNCFPNETGGIVDDLIVYKLADDNYFLVVNASNIDKDFSHLEKYNAAFGCELINYSENYSILAIQGPKAINTLQKLTDVDLSEVSFYHFTQGSLAGVDNLIISATGYTGAGGFELYIKKEDTQKIWDAVFIAGEEYGIQPIGLAARDTLRLEMGYCLYGNDINDTTSPIAAGLGWITKFDKSFVNDHALKEEKEKGSTQKLVGFELIERGIPRHDYEIVDSQGNQIGMVTSGTMSPSLGIGLGLGYVNAEHASIGSEIFIKIRKNNVAAKVVKLPFYRKNN